jgi:hypothetical protein
MKSDVYQRIIDRIVGDHLANCDSMQNTTNALGRNARSPVQVA